jgi:hypothetical protein
MKEIGFTHRIRLLVSTSVLAILLSLPFGIAGVSAGQIVHTVHPPMQMARGIHSSSQIARGFHQPVQSQ